MKVIIAGGREVPTNKARKLVREAIEASGWIDLITEIVHGDCPTGIDAAAQFMCEKRWPIKKFPADWEKHGKFAGPLRNFEMSQYAEALIGIWNGSSRGTASMIKEATDEGLKIFIWRYDDVKEGS